MGRINKSKFFIEKLEKEFKEEDYNKYINKDLTLSNLADKYQVSKYYLSQFFKLKNYKTRKKLKEEYVKDDIFEKINCPENAYILGFYIADGCINGNRFSIRISAKDRDLLEKIKNYISPISKINDIPEKINKQGIKSNAMCDFSIRNDKIVNSLINLGLGYNKTYSNKSIKNVVPKEFMWDFIRGYFDGDGCISCSLTHKKHQLKSGELKIYSHLNIGFTIISKDKFILEEMNDFMKSQEIDSYIYPDNKNNFLIGTHSEKEILKIYNKLYTKCNLYLKRKLEKFQKIIENTEVSSEITKGSETP